VDLVREAFIGARSLILLGFAAATALIVLNAPGSDRCSPQWVLMLLLSATLMGAAVIGRRDGSSITFLPAVLVSSWLTCGGPTSVEVALVSAFAGGVLRSRALPPSALGGLAALGGALSGGIAGSTVVLAIPLVLPNGEQSLSSVLFVSGYWMGEVVLIRAGRLLVPHAAAAVPCSNVATNMLLLFPGSVIAQIQMEHDLLFSGPLLLLLVLALWMITLHAGALASRERAVAGQANLQSAIDQVPEAIVIVGPDLRIQWVNEAGARLAGSIPSATAGRPCGEVFLLRDTEGAPVDHGELLARAAGQSMSTSIDCELRTDDGRTVRFLATYSAALDESGSMQAGAISLHPEPPAEKADERATILAHELRSPLTSITLLAGLLARTDPSDQARQERYLTAVTASGQHMLRLVNNILDLQEIGGGQPLSVEQVPLEAVLNAGLAIVRPGADEKRIRLSLGLEQGLDAVLTNELFLRRALDNLLSNAVKYTPAGGAVEVSAAREADGIAIAVRDTGIGLTESEQEKLFQRFFRSARPEARAELGTGLGLVLVRESVQRLGGNLRVESLVGRGSTFTIWLPLEANPLPNRTRGSDSSL
jgi:signal transduction histidine kinase